MFFAFAGLAVVLAFVAVAVAAAVVGPASYAALANLMLAGAVIAVFVTVIGTVVFFVGDVRRGRRRRAVRSQLAVFMQSGQTFITACHAAARANSAAPDVSAWSEEVFNYLRDTAELGPDFAVRFDSAAGLPAGFTTLSPPYSNAESHVKSRLARLAEIARALGESDI